MSYLEVGGRRHPIPVGEMVIGSARTAHIVLPEAGVSACHAVVQGMRDGQTVIRPGNQGSDVRVNGVRLGAQPTPLLHGDKVEIGPTELLFVDERRSGSTQYVQAIDPAAMAADRPKGGKAPTAATGGTLVSLIDGREYTVRNSLVIGRDAGCDVVLTSRSVSRRHAEVVVSPLGYVLVDSSTNGTLVNGKRIQGQQVLARGDVIRCGDEEFRFHADAASEPVPEPPPAPGRRRDSWSLELSDDAAPGAEHRLNQTLHGFPAMRPSPVPPLEPPAADPGVAQPVAPPPDAKVAKAAAAPDGMANLIVRTGVLKGHRFPIRVPIVNVGRADYNDIVLPDDSVSTTHAKLQRREGIWVVVDLDSTNGTLVDGERVSGEAPLAPGAYVRFGDVQTVFEPTDDTIDPRKGSSTKLMSAVKPIPAPPAPRKPTE
jgi:pSer/pThr/pTyr-binding forkhead associated (FHA) protein